MRILIIGAHGTIGKRLTPALAGRHEVLSAGRNSGDYRVDVSDEASVKALYNQVSNVDACICVAASGPLDNFSTLTEEQLLKDMKGKLFGQINLVLLGQNWLNTGGSFTLTSGIFADQPYPGVTGGAVTSGALHSFTRAAACELKNKIRVNCVSPGMAADAAEAFGHLFPGLKAVSMEELVAAYVASVEGSESGRIYRAYG
ncbi:short chain dehydrogenase [Pedobacter yulinensis]|uniref:Short chain dehydrogenase n=1 Tax=Pedobacter yulinensis TaxID=2126353 RepID=A0A2T3HLU3_9SPHI|nr:short chain dehydrogenase [Pedobacter yulinensis]PST83407.1 short chain dehydrogenase [Pedobacter yulinensis]